MSSNTLLIHEHESHIKLTLNRSHENNSITSQLLHDLNHALDTAEKQPNCKVVILEGSEAFFCSGMDFKEILQLAKSPTDHEVHQWATLYLSTLKRLTTTPKIILTLVEGKAQGGGVGLVAASDIVIASEKAQFSLPEMLWGLLPAMITPFLMRRLGFQKTYALSMTSYTLSSKEALECHLVDELTQDMDQAVKRRLKHLNRLEGESIRNLKNYFQSLWKLSPETEQTALSEITRLIRDPLVQQRITNFLEQKILPWEK